MIGITTTAQINKDIINIALINNNVNVISKLALFMVDQLYQIFQ